MDGKQVFSLIMLGLAIVFVIRFVSCGLAMTSSPGEVSEQSYEREAPAGEEARAPSAVGAYYPKRQPKPNILLDNPALLATGAGVGVMGAFGAIGWLLLGGRRTPEVPAAPQPQPAPPQPAPAQPAPPHAVSGQIPAHAEAPIGDPSAPSAPQKFDKYGIPEGYVEEQGIDWTSVAKGGAGVLLAGTVLVFILIGPINIAFMLGIWLESMGF